MRRLILGAAAIALAASGANAQPEGKGNGKGNEAGGRIDASLSQGQGPDRNLPERVKVRPANGNAKGNIKGDRHTVPQAGIERRAPRPFDWAFADRDRKRSLIGGCPPGLASKYNGCNPPGQVREHTSDIFGRNFAPGLFGLSHYGSGRYFYDDGYLFSLLDDGGIGGYIPLLGGALAVGSMWPDAYESYDVPDYYLDYYNLGGPDRYRFADNVIYRIDPEDSAITSIAAILTGNQFTVGQPMPAGYDVYNVPYAYRDRYYDTPEAMYRYSDGHVYQVDPETQLIISIIDLLL